VRPKGRLPLIPFGVVPFSWNWDFRLFGEVCIFRLHESAVRDGFNRL
jgi:hypothetical protein